MTKEDFYGKKVCIVTTSLTRVSEGIRVMVNELYVLDPSKPTMVRPASGWDTVISGNSINTNCIYELHGCSNAQVYDQLGELSVAVHGYCLPENVDKLKAEQMQLVRTNIAKYLEEKREFLNKVEAIITT